MTIAPIGGRYFWRMARKNGTSSGSACAVACGLGSRPLVVFALFTMTVMFQDKLLGASYYYHRTRMRSRTTKRAILLSCDIQRLGVFNIITLCFSVLPFVIHYKPYCVSSEAGPRHVPIGITRLLLKVAVTHSSRDSTCYNVHELRCSPGGVEETIQCS
jgi:hypothetical protein